MDSPDYDALFMKKAMEQAQLAFDEDEVPVGAVITCKNKIIGKGYNQTEKLKDVTAHAEMLAITAASANQNNKFLDECTLYITIEPCVMCAGAIKLSRLGKIVIGASEPKMGFSNFLSEEFNSKTEVLTGLMEKECREIMQTFFKGKR